MTDKTNGFIQRWSQRKQRTQADGHAADEFELHQDYEPRSDAGEITTSEKSIDDLTDADMPALDTLDENSDYSGFLSRKVSVELRRQALRKLFHQPAFNIRDGLCEYDDDYTQFEKLGDIVTSDMKHMIEVAKQREQEKQAEEMAADEHELIASGTGSEANIERDLSESDHDDSANYAHDALPQNVDDITNKA